MRVDRLLVRGLTTLGLIFSLSVVKAQNPRPQIQTEWLDEHTLAIFPESEHLTSSVLVETAMPGGGLKSDEIQGPEVSEGYGLIVHITRDAVWANLQTAKTDPDGHRVFVTKVVRSAQNHQWEIVGVYQQSLYYSADLYPLDNGKFLACFGSPSTRDMTKAPPGGYHPLGIVRDTGRGRLDLESWQDLDLEKPYFHRPAASVLQDAYHLGECVTYPGLGLEYGTGSITRVGHHYVLPAMKAGWFFVFSAKDGHLERKVQLYSSVDEKQLQNSSMGWVVVGYQPTPNDCLLVAARQEAGIAAFRPVRVSPDLTDEEFEKVRPMVEKQMDENLSNYSLVMWYSIDPDEGTVHELAPPRNFPDFIKSQKEFSNYRFRFMADGNLRFGDQAQIPAKK